MFKKRFEALEISVQTSENGQINVYLEQPDPFQDGPSVIIISPEQIDSVIESLKEAKASLDQNHLQ